MSSQVADFNTWNKILTAKLFKQGCRYHKLRKPFSKFYRHHCDLVSKFNVGRRSLFKQGLSELEFYGDFVYKFRKIVRRNDLSDQFRKIIIRYKTTGYSMNVMRRTACLAVNSVMVGNFTALFNYMPVGRAADLMMAPAYSFQLSWLGLDALSLVGPTEVHLLDLLLQRFSVDLAVEYSSMLKLDLYVCCFDSLTSWSPSRRSNNFYVYGPQQNLWRGLLRRETGFSPQ